MPQQPATFIPDTPAARAPASFVPDAGQVNVGAGASFTVNDQPVEDNIGTMAGHVWNQINPVAAVGAIGQALPIPKALGGGGVLEGPLNTIKGLGAAQGELYNKAKASYEKGDYGTAARHFVDYLIPLIGPVLDKSADAFQEGRPWAGAGDAVGVGLAMFGPKALASRVPKTAGAKALAPSAGRVNAAERSALDLAQSKGIPIDLGTMTGSPFVRHLEQMAGSNLGGAGIAEKFKANQTAALRRTGERIGGRVAPVPETNISAGEGVHGALSNLVRGHAQTAQRAYGKLEQIAGEPGNAQVVSVAKAGERAGGGTISALERGELNRIHAELTQVEYGRRTMNPIERGAGGDAEWGAGHGNAPVYRDIVSHANSPATGPEIRDAISRGLQGQPGPWFDRALAVARDRIGKAKGMEKPLLPPDAGYMSPSGALDADAAAALRKHYQLDDAFDVGELDRPTASVPGQTRVLQMPVDVQAAKASFKPLYDQLMREKELTPLVGAKGRALVALDRLMTGPDLAALVDVDAALSTLKSFVRAKPGSLAAEIPELKSAAQGMVGQAVKALDQQVWNTARHAGPEAVKALTEGRAATVAKYRVSEVMERSPFKTTEPGQLFQRLTAQKDTSLNALREVQKLTPEQMPKIARALWEDFMAKAEAEGGFGHADKLWSDWERLGPDTKTMLYGKNRKTMQDFLLAAKMLSKVENASGTARSLNATKLVSAPIMWAVAKVAYESPRVMAQLVRVQRAAAQARRATAAAGRAMVNAAWANLLKVARAEGVPVNPALVPVGTAQERQ